jgi:D-alanyl-D-alanine carboxypeptidase
MTRIAHPILLCCVLLIGCGAAEQQQSVGSELTNAFQAILDEVVAADETIPGVIMHVEAPRLGISWGGAAGVIDFESGRPLTAANPVRIASNTKTYTAAAILRLMEQGKLDLDDSMVDYLPADLVDIVAADGYRPQEITIRHLITHTSGLFDYGDYEGYGEAVMSDLTHRWTREEQLQKAMEWGEPYGDPGEVYRYSDTGYILLGEIIEQVTGKTMAAAFRELLKYDENGLRNTWLESAEPVPTGTAERAHQYFADADTHDGDPSFDLYGGGGNAATMKDLALFLRALFVGGIYDDPATLDTMLTTIEGAAAGPAYHGSEMVPGSYKMGLVSVDRYGPTGWAHGGFWGTGVIHFPGLDITVATSVNQQMARPDPPIADRALKLLINAASE